MRQVRWSDKAEYDATREQELLRKIDDDYDSSKGTVFCADWGKDAKFAGAGDEVRILIEVW